MDLLPKWKFTKTLPAFKDGESASVVEQTYKLYKAMEKLSTEYNAFAESVNTILSENETKFNHDLEIYATSLRQEFQDFIDVVDLKLSSFTTNEEEITQVQKEIEELNKKLVEFTSTYALKEHTHTEYGSKEYITEQINNLKAEIIADLEGDY